MLSTATCPVVQKCCCPKQPQSLVLGLRGLRTCKDTETQDAMQTCGQLMNSRPEDGQKQFRVDKTQKQDLMYADATRNSEFRHDIATKKMKKSRSVKTG